VVAAALWYLIPGLGADERVFQFLRLQGKVQVLRWLAPENAKEPLPHYAARLAASVPGDQVCWIVGVSFGGVLAQEVGRLRPLARVVLVSSFTGSKELPWLGRVSRATGLHHFMPPQLLPRLPRVAQWFFGVKNGREYQLLRQILRDTDPHFTRWALVQLLQWPGRPEPPAVRIHGAEDRLLPSGAAHSQYALPGGHLIIVSQAREISRILNSLASGPT
jgi:pimeloyl-ACP methyl ester carboxylesterase